MLNTQQVILPKKLFSSMLDVFQKWQMFSDELEDFLLSNDQNFLAKMRQARCEHIGKNIRNLSELKSEI